MFFHFIVCTVNRVYLLCEFKILPWPNWYIIFQTNGLNVWNVGLMMWSEPSPAPSAVVRKTFWAPALLQSISSNTFITARVTRTHTPKNTRRGRIQSRVCQYNTGGKKIKASNLRSESKSAVAVLSQIYCYVRMENISQKLQENYLSWSLQAKLQAKIKEDNK